VSDLGTSKGGRQLSVLSSATNAKTSVAVCRRALLVRVNSPLPGVNASRIRLDGYVASRATPPRRSSRQVRRPASGVRRQASGVRRQASGVRRPASGVQ
jgi:hypothetical protein